LLDLKHGVLISGVLCKSNQKSEPLIRDDYGDFADFF
jgi:hypothetical protein